jgi:CheY-like chemotaxis protein
MASAGTESCFSCGVPRETDPILIVDDSEEDALLFRSALEEAQIINPLFHASGYDQALEYFMGWGKYADRVAYPMPLILFLDINMPDKSGFELLEWIRNNELTKGLVVIMMSGSASEKDISRSYALGANSYLLKPETRKELLKALNHFRAYWLELNRYI